MERVLTLSLEEANFRVLPAEERENFHFKLEVRRPCDRPARALRMYGGVTSSRCFTRCVRVIVYVWTLVTLFCCDVCRTTWVWRLAC
jgi:hypothetical protein